MKASELDLAEPALGVALALEAAFPFVEFTSGRRSLAEQAQVMAENVVRNPRWIVQTYKACKASTACQDWCDRHIGAPLAALSAGLLSVLCALPESEVKRVSKHLAGLAFDVRPIAGPEGLPVAVWLRLKVATLGGKFLEREGGLTRWHVQL